MLMAFWGYKAPIVEYYMPTELGLRSSTYCDLLENNYEPAMRSKCRGMLISCVLLQHGIAYPRGTCDSDKYREIAFSVHHASTKLTGPVTEQFSFLRALQSSSWLNDMPYISGAESGGAFLDLESTAQEAFFSRHPRGGEALAHMC